MRDTARLTDDVTSTLHAVRPTDDRAAIRGRGVATVRGPDGDVVQQVAFDNLVTDVGDGYYAAAAAGLHASGNVGDPDPVTGMRLGTGGATAAAKNGAGAAIVTYVSGSNQAIDAGFPTHDGTGLVTWQSTWAAGDATANGIDEVVITNEVGLTDVAGTAANTISRAVLSPVVNKGASDTLEVTWTHTLTGA